MDDVDEDPPVVRGCFAGRSVGGKLGSPEPFVEKGRCHERELEVSDRAAGRDVPLFARGRGGTLPSPGRNYSVEIEHFLVKLLEPADTDLARILRHFEVDASRLGKDLTAAIGRLKRAILRAISMSDRIPQWVEAAWLRASIDYDPPRCGPAT
jgi:hypothetical protein